MFQDIDLRELAEHHGPDRAFLTAYLPDRAAAQGMADRAEETRRLLSGQDDDLEHFEHNLRLAQQIVEQHDFDDGSLAVFACWALDLHRGYPLPVQVPSQFRVGSCFHLRPLAELQDEHERFAAVTASNGGAEVWLVSLPEAQQLETVHASIKNHVKKGGWSQKRYQRRRREQIHAYAQEVVDVLSRLHAETRFHRLVLLGGHDAIHAIERELPPALAKTLIEARNADVGDPDRAIEEHGEALNEQAERQAERRLWETIREEALGQGLAVTGPAAVLEAVRSGRADAVLLHRELEVEGTQCRECEHLVVGTPATCQGCGSADVFPIDAVNAVVDSAERTGATLDFVDDLEGLEQVGRIAALLRY